MAFGLVTVTHAEFIRHRLTRLPRAPENYIMGVEDIYEDPPHNFRAQCCCGWRTDGVAETDSGMRRRIKKHARTTGHPVVTEKGLTTFPIARET